MLERMEGTESAGDTVASLGEIVKSFHDGGAGCHQSKELNSRGRQGCWRQDWFWRAGWGARWKAGFLVKFSFSISS